MKGVDVVVVIIDEELGMCKVICFKHSSYNGKDRPNLACKVCCSMFILSGKEAVKFSRKTPVMGNTGRTYRRR